MSDHIEYIECACHHKDDLARITLWDNGSHGDFRDIEVYFEIPVSTAGSRWRIRLNAAWQILTGRKPTWLDTTPMYTYEQFKEFKAAIDRINDRIENPQTSQ